MGIEEYVTRNFVPREIIKDIVILNSNEIEIDRIKCFKFFADKE